MSTPISRPKLLRAVVTSDAPVPPSATAISSISVNEPPVIDTLSDACVAIDPRPKDNRASGPLLTVQVAPSETIKWSWLCVRSAIAVRLAFISCLSSSCPWISEVTP